MYIHNIKRKIQLCPDIAERKINRKILWKSHAIMKVDHDRI